jgi:hypothetical protein
MLALIRSPLALLTRATLAALLVVRIPAVVLVFDVMRDEEEALLRRIGLVVLNKENKINIVLPIDKQTKYNNIMTRQNHKTTQQSQ